MESVKAFGHAETGNCPSFESECSPIRIQDHEGPNGDLLTDPLRQPLLELTLP